MIINAENYSIIPDSDASVALQEAFAELAKTDGEKTLLFKKGEYHFYSDKVYSNKLFITNTVGDKEWKKGEVPHLNRAAVWLEGQKDLTVDGNGSTFVIHGSMTNVVIKDCLNVKLVNVAFVAENPDMHELKVVAKDKRHVDFQLDSESKYDKVKGKFCYVGTDFTRAFTQNRIAWWIGKIPADNINSMWRVSNPFGSSLGIKEIKPYTFRATYLSTAKFSVGDRFYVYDHRRKYAGIFVDRSKDVVLDGINQHFNYSLALVCQDSENLTMTNSKFKPKEGGAKLVASAADFVHICSCRGDIVLKDNEFEGAGDDCLNVHGIHFRIIDVNGDAITVKFSHPQAHGFNPLRAGDSVAFVNIDTLLEDGRANILESKLLDEYRILLKLDDTAKAKVGMAIENKSAIANLEFVGNKMTRIITRGVLVTTGGRVKILDNDFDNTSMHSILVSDDAKYWFESGPVSDVEIARNRFGRCVGYNVQVLPENTVHAGAVHKNIYIHDNVLESGKEGGFYFKSTDGVILENNKSDGKIRLESVNSQIEQR
ncbi:MAG: right-handed parallel beta-helix repeat-containing protein [Clostridia bacterium]|nr:right-handed parallel beta-helix repeat-containing protein [Clostridia bacterium]MDE7328848.1 right-handed parallel beta-helix repeat-containing protein [Clostridia bacterium]